MKSMGRSTLSFASGVAFCVWLAVSAGAVANVTNTLPLFDTFEQYTNKTQLVGQGGWYGEDENALEVITNTYTWFGQYPIEPTNHTKIVQLNAAVTNLFKNTDDMTNIWVDLMLQPKRWQQDDPPTLPTNTQMALYFNSNGNIVAWCEYMDTNYFPTVGWVTMDHTPIQSNQWIRLTVQLSYDYPGTFGGDYFRLQLDNSKPVTNYAGYLSPYSNWTHYGSWFRLADQNINKLNSLGFAGTGFLDDLSVRITAPAIATRYQILSTSSKGASIAPNGYVNVVSNGTATIVFAALTGYDLTGAAWGVGWDEAARTNAIDINVTHEHTFPNVTSDMSIHASAQPQPRSYTIAKKPGTLGAPNPVEGTYASLYDTALTPIINYTPPAVISNEQRYYCTWTRTVSDPKTDQAGTSAPFTLRGATTADVTTLTWNYRLQNRLNTEVTGSAGFMAGVDGSVSVGDGWYDMDASKSITATPYGTGVGHWNFVNWSGTTSGCTIAANQITVPMSSPRTNVTAYFDYTANGSNRTLVVYSEQGGATPPVGTNHYADGTVVTCSVTNSPIAMGTTTQIVCSGWTGSGRVPFNGTGTSTPQIRLTQQEFQQESEITWRWTTQYRLAITNGGSGVGTVNASTGWRNQQTEVSVTATAESDSTFSQWTGDTDGCTITGNIILIPMDRARSIVAVFVLSKTAHGVPGWWMAMYGLSSDMDDDDHDHSLNWEEYVAGTIPTDPDSVFHIIEVKQTAGQNEVKWFGTTNSGVTDPFSIYRSTDLSSWDLVMSNNISRDGSGTNMWTDDAPPTGAKAFYKPMVIWTNSTP